MPFGDLDKGLKGWTTTNETGWLDGNDGLPPGNLQGVGAIRVANIPLLADSSVAVNCPVTHRGQALFKDAPGNAIQIGDAAGAGAATCRIA